MKYLTRRGRIVWVAVLLGIAEALAAEPPAAAKKKPESNPTEPLPATLAAAAKHGISLESRRLEKGLTGRQPGNRVVAVASLVKGEDFSQWLVQLKVVEGTDAEKRTAVKSAPFYIATGAGFTFEGEPVVIESTVIGPLRKKDAVEIAVRKAKLERARIVVNSALLELGLERAAAAYLRGREKGAYGALTTSAQPFPATQIGAAQEAARKMELTPEEERAVAGASPALTEFALMVSKTPGLEELMRQVVDVPWLSLVARGGRINLGLEILGDHLGRQEEAYRLPFLLKINDKPAVACFLWVDKPTPEVMPSAGILNIFAAPPDGKGAQLSITLVAAGMPPEPAAAGKTDAAGR